MTKSLLSLYLQRVKDGDDTFIPKLAERLSERLIYVPVEAAESQADGSEMRVSPFRMVEAKRKLVPIFTSEQLFRKWAQSRPGEVEFISLLGGDFCAALVSQKTWLLVNPGGVDSVELQPSIVGLIAGSSTDSGMYKAPVVNKVEQEELLVDQTEVSKSESVEPVVESLEPNVERTKTVKISIQPGSNLVIRSEEEPDPKQKKKSFLNFLKSAK